MQQAVGSRKPGYDVHHIVEQGSPGSERFPASMLQSPENKVLIPRLKHWQITGWYMTRNDRFDGLSPRLHLRDRGWAERRRIGLETLVEHGMLAP